VVLGHAGQPLFAVAGAIDDESGIGERFLHRRGQRRFVLHHQYARALEHVARRRLHGRCRRAAALRHGFAARHRQLDEERRAGAAV